MFGINFYDKKNNKNVEESTSDNTIYVVNNNNIINEELELKQEYFDRWKELSINLDEYKSNNNEEESSCENNKDDASVYSESDLNNNEGEKINENDDDEDIEERLYVISLDGSPHYYEADLKSARSTMWKIANNLLRNNNDDSSFYSDNYIFTNSLNKVSLISPYYFFGLNYHYTICELQIDYIIKYNNQ